jgi:hypothetical protein
MRFTLAGRESPLLANLGRVENCRGDPVRGGGQTLRASADLQNENVLERPGTPVGFWIQPHDRCAASQKLDSGLLGTLGDLECCLKPPGENRPHGGRRTQLILPVLAATPTHGYPLTSNLFPAATANPIKVHS